MNSLLGRRVRIRLTQGQDVRGVLHALDSSGVTIAPDIRRLDGAQFYPMHRVLDIDDEGGAP